MSKAYIMFTVGFIILIVSGLSSCESVSTIQGQNVTLHFPYPCNTTKVTLQKSNRHPFYISLSGPDLFLSQSKANRFKVYDKNDYDNCSVDLMISNLMKDDQGTYILFVYKDGDIQGDDTHRIYLKVDHPPGKASCVVGVEMGGDWVSLDCQANAGSLPGKIECYQTGVRMPSLAGPTETGSLLEQSILIRQSGPVFCCSSLIDEVRERCDCKDTSHYLSDGDYIDPCPTPSPTFPGSTTMLIPSTFIENNQSDYSLVTPSTLIKMEEDYDNVRLIFLSSLGLASMLLYIFLVCVYKCNPARKSNSNSSNDPPRAHNTVPLLTENERDSVPSKGNTRTAQASF
ncbi:uncharacterized protein LOC121413144 [Lytechinus variegatus]|uniref:uncharacterized protein LOC121413119 n=1 Tax=Lytechinus variegatus TaxID=7654 RepID=UPI001BB291BD|nr:uncharacterized protein LOC121413119 [Lytechinus variegatus]XP_041461842.1 uncharacterized protein LOC121413144 [Lytechinus variegatus]